MTRNMQHIIALTSEVRAANARNTPIGDELLKKIIVALANEVTHLSRELETVRTTAERAQRQSRMPVYLPTIRR